MNPDIIKGNWKEAKGKIKQQWGKITDDEITQMPHTAQHVAPVQHVNFTGPT